MIMEKKKKRNYLTIIAGLVLIALICLILYIAKEYFAISSLQKQYTQNQEDTSYRYHCAFITSSVTAFWDSAFEAARDEGIPNNIYVEDFGKNLDLSYTTNDLLKMAIAAHVDAIMIEANGDYSTTQLMNKAAAAGIAVSTIYRDNMNSERYSYTGVNNVTIGYDYGTLALKYADNSDSNVMVILDSQEQDTESRLLISGIGKALEEQRRDMKLDTMKLDNSNAFEVEESIREYLKENHDKTDIVIDAAQMGRRAVENLAEYLEYGHTSDYSQVDVHTLEQKDAIRQLNALPKETESETGKGA